MCYVIKMPKNTQGGKKKRRGKNIAEPELKVVEAQEEQNRYVVKVLFNVASIAEPQKLETYFERV